MNRGILSLCRTAPLLRRALHKGVDSTPPLRWTSVGERIALYCAISFTFLSYPTYVLLNLDNLRPKVFNSSFLLAVVFPCFFVCLNMFYLF
ncbi:hypothetical protein OESDEN_11849 [Oesophagostomum dentatum]|uniref:Uncharacterized protein n=1 Tax=Oesophagostomum dentatum TaxID=61180 RepID=A0A0B1SSS1_OESDE|nr:hypothetical protein OESDEN_11849 [Oesophagostomum dentatum]